MKKALIFFVAAVLVLIASAYYARASQSQDICSNNTDFISITLAG